MDLPISIINELLPADVDEIVRYHYQYYADNHGFNHDFGTYVEEPLTEFYHRNSPTEKIWLLKQGNLLKGCIALTRVSGDEAQLRWFYVDESLRGRGFGQKLIDLLISFAGEMDYQRIILWTVSLLDDARRLYEKNGFVLEEEYETGIWGKVLVEQKFVKILPGNF